MGIGWNRSLHGNAVEGGVPPPPILDRDPDGTLVTPTPPSRRGACRRCSKRGRIMGSGGTDPSKGSTSWMAILRGSAPWVDGVATIGYHQGETA